MHFLWSLSPLGELVEKRDFEKVPIHWFEVCDLPGGRVARVGCSVNPKLAEERGWVANPPATALLRMNPKYQGRYTAYGTAYMTIDLDEDPLDVDYSEVRSVLARALGEEEEDAAAEVMPRPRRAVGPPQRFVP